MNTCEGCDLSSLDDGIDISILLAWYNTCIADEDFGSGQAIKCWEGQPGNDLPCVENTEGRGGTGVGGDAAQTSTVARYVVCDDGGRCC